MGMVRIGKTARLQVIRMFDFGVFLHGDNLGDILVPARFVPRGCRPDDWLDVFVYLDSDDNIIATTEKPYVEVGECAYLEVIDKNAVGVFMNWGLTKDLFVPFNQQRVPMEKGRSYVVYVYEDKSGRICGSTKLDHFLDEYADGHFERGQEVDLLIAGRSPLGYKAVINGTHLGLLYNSDLLAPVKTGQYIKGYIKNIRPDEAIDLSLQQQGQIMRDSLPEKILADLKARGGISHLTDKSPAEEIFARYQVSKSNYKKAIGQLYKDKKILLTKNEITLV